MDVTDGLANKLPALIQTLLAGVKEDEVAAIAAFHVSIQEAVAGEQAVVAHLFAELDQRIAKFAAALSAAFPVYGAAETVAKAPEVPQDTTG